MWGAYVCIGAYERDVVVVIKMGAYIHGCLFCVGVYYPNFTVFTHNLASKCLSVRHILM